MRTKKEIIKDELLMKESEDRLIKAILSRTDENEKKAMLQSSTYEDMSEELLERFKYFIKTSSSEK